MDVPIHAAAIRFRRLAGLADLRNLNLVAALFAGLIALQALDFLVLGTGRGGRSVSLIILVAHNLLALACAGTAFRCPGNVVVLFWFLYAISLLIC